MRSAFAPPRKGETFELRAGLVYDPVPQPHSQVLTTCSAPSMRTKGISTSSVSLASSKLHGQEGIDTEDYHGHDTWQGRVSAIPRCTEKHSHCGLGPEEACVPLFDVRRCSVLVLKITDQGPGITQNPTPTCAFSRSIHLFRTLKIPTH
jgi:hypothetical protein